MRRTLLVTNDFPPRPGGIQSYLHTFAGHLPADKLVVYAPRWRGDSHKKFDARTAFRGRSAPHDTDAADAVCRPSGREAGQEARLRVGVVRRGGAPWRCWRRLSPRRSEPSDREYSRPRGRLVDDSRCAAVVARIGEHTDAVTFVSKYTRGRFAAAFGPQAALEHLPSGVDTSSVPPGLGRPRRTAGAIRAGGAARRSCACPGSCHARGRTCSSRRCRPSARASTARYW